jgi:peptidoglycan/LPS O-acetylase OafA/YrhL
LLQSIFAYIVGIRVFESLRTNHGVSYGGSVMVTLITCIVITVPAAELFHRLIVVPSRYLSHNFYEFITSWDDTRGFLILSCFLVIFRGCCCISPKAY